ncbi:MAG: aminotransferase class III-fold pyridoxal phosphate-dependent enzyme, partial [Actinobacteria bacterium]|nr:aminotransferase class III-fold pyridoxal phosphate-dependent enzyme [Actinomycetota bacterium]
LTDDNVLVGPDRRPSGIVDFGDATHSPLLFDLAVALASFCIRDDLFERAEAFLRGYGEVTELEEDEAELLGGATSARMAASVLISAWRVARFPENADYITAFDARTWEVLAYLDELGAQEAGRRFRAAAAPATTLRLATRVEAPATDALLERRRRAFGPAATAPTYERPLHFVRGEGVWLVERDGRRYLDAYNNVPAVGHSHPRVVAAIAAQARLLNTNTRYLHETAVVLAERLTATLPAALDTCLFVNSGSEANELAWRLATAATGVGGALVSERAYHGVTAVMTDLSPSEWASDSRPDYVATIPAPRREGAAAPEALRTLADRGHRPAAFFLDSAWTSDGIFTEAWDYAAAAVAAARNAGGLFVADEVQAGFARFGSSMWSFEPSGVEPDFVTMGKPMGNGHPVAAVVTRREIAAEFGRRQAPIFSTFGGNPVACAAALAVLDVIEEDGLRESVVAVGSHLRAGLDALMRRHPAVQEVRGRGLLLGVELEDGAERVVNELRERGVLVGVTGPRENVLKIRPPLVFRREHADLLVTALDEALPER